ncbi:tudor domain-containing protein 15 [Hippocampus zosterae]|uniref:tudor domain-containing protein 15 n=1 Tax=Hippocampus zosterae TaxID=109293 RepID=UPI00223C9056|nr:tudor domain-containing protein 15 [Hippocampus zosterae]
MQPLLNVQHHRSLDSGPSGPCALVTVDLKLSHLDWSPEATLIHFQGQYLTTDELDYNILQQEIQNTPKTNAKVDVGEFCLVKDVSTAQWYRGRVQRCNDCVSDVFLIDHGSILSVDVAHIASSSNDLFSRPPKIVCGFLANVLVPASSCHSSGVVDFLSSLIGKSFTGCIQTILPHRVLLLDIPDINNELVRQGLGKHMDKDTFLLLVELLTGVPLKPNIDPFPDLLANEQGGHVYRPKLSGLKVYEEILSFCGPRLSCGTRAKVRVTAAVHSSLFYCQMASKESELRLMSKKLAAVSELGSKYHPRENVGLLCSAKGKSGKWYRGFVQFLPMNSEVQVLFVDFGFSESVKVEDVHSLPPDLYSTPIMAFPCSLSARKSQDEELVAQQSSYLKAGLLGGVLEVRIDSFDEEQCLYLITGVGALDKYVTEEVTRELPPQIKEEPLSTVEDVAIQDANLSYETIIGQELVKTLKEEELQVHSVFEGFLEYAQNPSNFWIRTTKRNGEFQEIMNKMSDHFAGVKLEDDVLLNPQPGTLCCALYEADMHFYRGVVTNELKHGAEVLFIDFGNVEKVPRALIKKIPEAFAGISAFALCCTLVNVMPLDDVWTHLNCDFFRAALFDKALRIHIVQIAQHKCVIDLYRSGSDNGRSISQLMVSSGQAEYWKIIPVKPMEQNPNDGKTSKGIRESHVSGNEACEEEEDKRVQKSSLPTSFKILDVRPGYEFPVRCSCINSASDFWCQVQDKVPDMEDLMGKIQRYYTLHTVPLQNEESCCVAKSPQDGRWYRASIQERQKDHAKVLLVDYGFSVQVQVHQLQGIMPEYVVLESQAFRCSLRKRTELVGTSEELSDHLRRFISDGDGNLRCKVVSQLNDKSEPLNIVELFNTRTQQGVTNQHLAKKKRDFPEEFVYSSFGLMPNDEEQVYVTHISGEWDIYCQLHRNTEAIADLEVNISEAIAEMKRASGKDAPAKMCLAKYLDGNWYRALVHTVPSPLHLSVFFVDYGNRGIAEKTHVVSIPRGCDHLLSTPVQALKFNLASVSRKEFYTEVKEWLDGTVLNKQVRAILLGKSQDGSFDVQLFDGDLNINEKVKELIGRVSSKPRPTVRFTYETKNHKRAPRSKNLRPADYSPRVTRNEGAHDWARPRPKKEHVKSFENRRQRRYPKNETPARTPNSKSCTLKSGEEQVTVEKTKVPAARKEPPLVRLPDRKEKEDCTLLCFVSHIDSVSRFFLQLSEEEAAILKMVDEINSMNEHSLRAAVSVRFDELVLARYDEDAALYRAVVRAYEGHSRFKVYFLDFGNSAVVEKDEIYTLPQEYFSLPAFSIQCSLVDLTLYNDDAAFTDAVMGKPLMVHFIQKWQTHWEVEMEIIDDDNTPDEQILKPPEGVDAPACTLETNDAVKIWDQTALKVTENEQGTFETRVTDTKPTEALCETFKTKSKRPIKIRSKRKKLSKKKSVFSVRKKDCTNAPVAHTQLLQQNQQLLPPPPPCESQNEQLLPNSIRHRKLVFAPISLNKEYSAFVASVTTPSEFCVVLKDSLPVMNKVAIMLEYLSESELPLLPKSSLTTGVSCLVRSDHNKWRRAEVRHVDSSGGVLDLVDYGICEQFAPQDHINLRVIPEDLLNIPKMVYPCVLRGVSPARDDDHWREDATIYFQEFLNCSLKVVFREVLSSTRWAADLLVNGVHAAGKLVTAGHGRFQEQSQHRLYASTEAEHCPELEATSWDSSECSGEAMKMGRRKCILQ